MLPRGTRPTTDRVRESLFNVLTARMDLHGAVVLDLYAGSGALGLEALSRGAANAVFVESDQRAAAVITQNIKTLGVTGATVRRGTVAAVLGAGAENPVDLVFADPPYSVGESEVNEMLTALTNGGWTGAQRRRRRARRIGARIEVAGRLGAVADPPLRRHLSRDGRKDLSCRPDSVVIHERRGMPDPSTR